MSNSNYSIDLQRLKPVHTSYCGLHNLAENWSLARHVNGRDRDETETLTIFREMRPRQDVGTSRGQSPTETVSRPRRQDRDHNPDINPDAEPTPTITLAVSVTHMAAEAIGGVRAPVLVHFALFIRTHRPLWSNFTEISFEDNANPALSNQQFR